MLWLVVSTLAFLVALLLYVNVQCVSEWISLQWNCMANCPSVRPREQSYPIQLIIKLGLFLSVIFSGNPNVPVGCGANVGSCPSGSHFQVKPGSARLFNLSSRYFCDRNVGICPLDSEASVGSYPADSGANAGSFPLLVAEQVYREVMNSWI